MLFLIFSIVLFNIIVFFIPKHMTKLEIYASSLFAIFLEYIANYVFDFIHRLYGYFNPGTDILTFVVVVGIYPAISTLFLNYFPFEGKTSKKLVYLLGWSLFSLFYEWLSIKSKYFYHSGWTFWLSLFSYPIIFFVMEVNLMWIRKLNNNEGRV